MTRYLVWALGRKRWRFWSVVVPGAMTFILLAAIFGLGLAFARFVLQSDAFVIGWLLLSLLFAWINR